MENTTLMLPETTETNWPDVGKILAIVLPMFFAVWHFINKFFADKEKDRVALISEVAKKTAQETVKETLGQYIAPLEKQIEEVKHGLIEVHKRIDSVLDHK